MTTIAHQVPPAWTPPRTWTPPPTFAQPSTPLTYRPAAGGAVAISIAASSLVLVAMGIVGAAVGTGRGGAGRGFLVTPQGRAEAWDGRSSLICNGDDRMTVRNKTADTGSQPAVIANGSCQLTMIDCRVKGQTGLIANGNVQVIVSGGSITGVTNSVIANGDARVELRGGARVVGQVLDTGGHVVRQGSRRPVSGGDPLDK
jgi:hypothetical protein